MTETQFAKKIGVTQSAFNRVIRGATGITLNIIKVINNGFRQKKCRFTRNYRTFRPFIGMET